MQMDILSWFTKVDFKKNAFHHLKTAVVLVWLHLKFLAIFEHFRVQWTCSTVRKKTDCGEPWNLSKGLQFL